MTRFAPGARPRTALRSPRPMSSRHGENSGDKESGETLMLKPGDRPITRVTLEWTFPLRFAELVSGDGRQVYRERIDLTDTGPFGMRTLTFGPNLRGRKWVRFEVWDVATNGAFTQPVWLAAQ